MTHWRTIRSRRYERFSDFDDPALRGFGWLMVASLAAWCLLLAGIAGFVWAVTRGVL